MTSPSHAAKMDQDLLLMAHGALPLGPRLRVSAHLKRCPECRTRLAELTQTSLRLAAAVRGPGQPAWSRADALARVALPGGRLLLPALIGLVTVLVVVCGWIAWTALAPPPPAPHSVSGGCRPDLPNSRCR